MAERYSLRGELEHAWRSFWGLGWRWKAPAMALAGLVLVGIIGASSDDRADDRPSPAVPDSSQASPTTEREPTATTAPSLTPTSTATSTPQPAATPRPAPTSTATATAPEWITGLDARNVTQNLENRGFECKGPTKLQTLSSWDCSDSTGEIVVSVLGRDSTHIRTIDSTVFAFFGAPSDETAANFLGFLATVPYDDASPAEARAWVEANISSGAETVFGSANFQLYGPPAARSLQIVAVGAK